MRHLSENLAPDGPMISGGVHGTHQRHVGQEPSSTANNSTAGDRGAFMGGLFLHASLGETFTGGHVGEWLRQGGATISNRHVTCSSPRRAVRSHSLVCIENSLLIVGIGPILNKELELIFRSDRSDRTCVYS